MSRHVLLDSNVVLDYFLKREGFSNSGLQVHSPEEFLMMLK
jgi:hypothetical protein